MLELCAVSIFFYLSSVCFQVIPSVNTQCLKTESTCFLWSYFNSRRPSVISFKHCCSSVGLMIISEVHCSWFKKLEENLRERFKLSFVNSVSNQQHHLTSDINLNRFKKELRYKGESSQNLMLISWTIKAQ